MQEVIVVPQQGGPLAEQAAQLGADSAIQQQQRANQLHNEGADQQAATAQEWGAMAVGVSPTDPSTGNKIPVGPTAYLMESPAANGKSALVQANPQDVKDVLHGQALAEDAERTAAQANAPVTKSGFLGKIGLGGNKK